MPSPPEKFAILPGEVTVEMPGPAARSEAPDESRPPIESETAHASD